MGSLAQVVALGCLLLSLTSQGLAAPQARKAGAATGKSEVNKLMWFLKGDGSYSRILALMKKARPGEQSFMDYLQAILAVDAVTLVLPKNQAWNKLSEKTKAQLSRGSTQELKKFLRFYVLKSRLGGTKLEALKTGTTFLTAEGSLMEKQPSNGKAKVILAPPDDNETSNRATIIHKDAHTSGVLVVHGIDTYMMPPDWE